MYAYTLQFEPGELIAKAVDYLDEELAVSDARYAVETNEQTGDMNREELNQGESFHAALVRERERKNPEVNLVKFDLLGKIAEGTVLTRRRRTVAEILQKISLTSLQCSNRIPKSSFQRRFV